MATKADNIIDMAIILYAILTIIGNSIQYVLLIRNKIKVRAFVLSMEMFINKSEKNNIRKKCKLYFIFV